MNFGAKAERLGEKAVHASLEAELGGVPRGNTSGDSEDSRAGRGSDKGCGERKAEKIQNIPHAMGA
jgi:hypothetical protein